MVAEQKVMNIPPELIPLCPKCGKPMTVNLRSDETFVEDDGWNDVCGRYSRFFESRRVRLHQLRRSVLPRRNPPALNLH